MPTAAFVDPQEVNPIEGQHRTRQGSHSRTTRSVLLAAGALALCLPGAAAGAVSPLPAADYAVRSVCAAPAPGYAGCLAVRLVPLTASARARTHPLGMTRNRPIASSSPAEGVDGLRPQDLRSAYFPSEPPEAPASEPQTIALVDAYDDTNAEADLNVYAEELGLPVLSKCTAGAVADCFEKVNQHGEATNLPAAEGGWALETSTDIEVAHAICQNCRILLVEANSSSYEDLEQAEETAVALGATEVSNSWGGQELPFDSPAFDHPKTVITAAAGDDGYLNWTEKGGSSYFPGADYPASSPHVVAVGGTRLTLGGGTRQSETVWNDGEANGAAGGGCSEWFTAPSWQQGVADWTAVGCSSKRAVADVSADADPYTGVAVYDSVPYPSEEEGLGATVLDWVPIGGTSVASPIVASVFALAGGASGVAYPAKTLYTRLGSPSGFPSLYDVAEGGNGKCDGAYPAGGCSGSLASRLDCGKGASICNAAPGYDGPTGVGAPDGVAAFEPESEEEHVKRVAAEAKATEEKQVEEERKATEAKQAAEAKAEEERKAKNAEEERRAVEKKLKEEEARSGTGEGSNGGEGATTSNGAGTGQLIAGSSSSAAGGLGGFPSGASAGPGGSAGRTVHLSRLALTARASAVIARGVPTLAQVAFAFTLSAPARVQVTLSRQTRVHGRLRWGSAPGALTLNVAAGRDRTHLRGRSALSPGRYRLTLAPAHGGARSIVFVLG